MQDYDVVLKGLLQNSLQLHLLTGGRIISWLPTELPKVQNLRVDLLGETDDGGLIQIEVQSTNDADIPLRMLEYLVLINRVHGRIPRQILLYVGRKPLRMASRLEWADGEARFTTVDLSTVDGEPLVASPDPGDNILGVLTRLKDDRAALRRILQKLSRLERDQADRYFQNLLILAGLRGLEEIVKEEATKLLTIDLSENKVLGPAYTRGLEEGRQQGQLEGHLEGQLLGQIEGRRGLLRRLIESKFGPLPPWVEQRLSQYPSHDLEQIGIRLFGAPTLDELFR